MAAGASALLVAIGGGTAAVSALTDNRTTIVTTVGQGSAVPPAGAAPAEAAAGRQAPNAAELPAADTGLGAQPQPEAAADADSRISAQADRTGTREPRRSTADTPPVGGVAGAAAPAAQAADPAEPAVTTRTVTETRAIPYRTRLIRDPRLPRGSKRIQTPGAFGEETLRYLVTYSGDRQTDRRLVDAQVTREPQHRVVAFGTQRDKGGRHCGPGIGNCLPIGRGAICPDDGKTPESGTLSVLDQDLMLLTAEDLDGLELDTAALCDKPAQ